MSIEEYHPIIQEAKRLRPTSFVGFWYKSLRFDSLRDSIESFLDRGFNGGMLTIQDTRFQHKVEFKKYIVAKGKYGLELVVQDNTQPEKYFTEIRDYLARNDTEFDIGKGEAGLEVLWVDCGKNVDKAHQLLIALFADVFELPANSKFRIEEQDASRWMEVIDSPDQQQAPMGEGVRLNEEWLYQKTGVSVESSVLCGLASLCKLGGLLGLLVTLVLQQDNWAGVTFWISGIHLQVPWAGVASVLLVLIGFLGMFTEAYWTAPKKKGSGMDLTSIPKTFRGLLLVFWGRPFNWISVGMLLAALYMWISFV